MSCKCYVLININIHNTSMCGKRLLLLCKYSIVIRPSVSLSLSSLSLSLSLPLLSLSPLPPCLYSLSLYFPFPSRNRNLKPITLLQLLTTYYTCVYIRGVIYTVNVALLYLPLSSLSVSLSSPPLPLLSLFISPFLLEIEI